MRVRGSAAIHLLLESQTLLVVGYESVFVVGSVPLCRVCSSGLGVIGDSCALRSRHGLWDMERVH